MLDMELLEKLKKALFEDWKKSKLRADGSYDEKLYRVTSKEFIKMCKEQNLCRYEELSDGTFKASLATLTYEEQPKHEEERKEDMVLLELCLKGLEKEIIAKELNKVYCEERGTEFKEFEELSEEDKNYFYNEIDICKKVIEENR